MGWAARTQSKGHPSRRKLEKRVVCCIHCGAAGGQRKTEPLQFVGVIIGQKVYGHPTCVKRAKAEVARVMEEVNAKARF